MIQRLKAGNEAGSGEMKRNEASTGHQISAQTARGNPGSFSRPPAERGPVQVVGGE